MKTFQLSIEEKETTKINKGMFGLFYEDINYACDGGISAQMLENACFEFYEGYGSFGRFSAKEDGLYGWLAYPTAGDGAMMRLYTQNPVHPNNPHYLHFESSDTQNGFVNKAYDGVCMEQGKFYTAGAYLRSDDYFGPVYVSVLEKRQIEGQRPNDFVVASTMLTRQVTREWTYYEITFDVPKDVRHGKFVISLGQPYNYGNGSLKAVSTVNRETVRSLEADFVSLKPDDAVMGVFRKDIVDMLRDMKPGFLRFPGGCIVEGARLSNRYQWKHTVGKREERIRTWSRWSLHFNKEEDDFSTNQFGHYNQSFDIGYYEYFLLCEYIGAKPLPVQNAGIACQYQTNQLVPVDSPEFMEFVTDVLDLIEFANGDVTTKWGSLRAAMGHPESFGLEMIGIGNEQWETQEVDFFERYRIFEEKIHAVYPDMKLIGSAGPDVTSNHYTEAWDYYRESFQHNDRFAYALDEHYYNPIPWFYDNTHFYDDYSREIKVFAGEYAAHTSWEDPHDVKNCLDAALAEAAFLTGVQRNSDVVVLTSYAPLFGRVNYTQWSPDLIWFDDKITYGSPNYYVQKMFMLHTGDVNLASSMPGGEKERIYHVVSKDNATGETIIKLVNGSDEAVKLRLDIAGEQRKDTLSAILITGEKRSTVNSVENPTAVCDNKVSMEYQEGYELPALSMVVIRLAL